LVSQSLSREEEEWRDGFDASQMESAHAAMMASQAFRRLVDILGFVEWELEFGRRFVVENEITNFTLRTTPSDANKPSGRSEVIFVNVFVSVYTHTEKVSRADNERSGSNIPITPPLTLAPSLPITLNSKALLVPNTPTSSSSPSQQCLNQGLPYALSAHSSS